MRKIIFALVLITFFTGCAGEEKKPEMKPETIVVPEVSSIPFDMIKLEDAPAVVRKITKTMENDEFFHWVTDNGNGYIILFPNTEIERIEQRVPSENYAWLNVKLKPTPKKTTDDDNNDDENEPAIAKFDLRNPPNAVGFQLGRNENLDQTSIPQPKSQLTPTKKPESKAVEQTQANNPPSQPEKDGEENDDNAKGPAIRITNPMPGDAVSSPIVVSGQVAMNVNARVRVIDSSEKVIAEKPVEIKDKKFETTLSFPPPANQEQGTVEAFLINPQDKSEEGRISIYVTLLPSQ